MDSCSQGFRHLIPVFISLYLTHTHTLWTLPAHDDHQFGPREDRFPCAGRSPCWEEDEAVARDTVVGVFGKLFCSTVLVGGEWIGLDRKTDVC